MVVLKDIKRPLRSMRLPSKWTKSKQHASNYFLTEWRACTKIFKMILPTSVTWVQSFPEEQQETLQWLIWDVFATSPTKQAYHTKDRIRHFLRVENNLAGMKQRNYNSCIQAIRKSKNRYISKSSLWKPWSQRIIICSCKPCY